MTAAQVAKAWKSDAATVNAWARRGLVNSVEGQGRTVEHTFRRGEIARWYPEHLQAEDPQSLVVVERTGAVRLSGVTIATLASWAKQRVISMLTLPDHTRRFFTKELVAMKALDTTLSARLVPLERFVANWRLSLEQLQGWVARGWLTPQEREPDLYHPLDVRRCVAREVWLRKDQS